MLEILKTLLSEFKANFEASSGALLRQYEFSSMQNKIKVAIGMRRVGKTYFLFETIRKLMAEKAIPWSRILYINFEDDRLLPCSKTKLREILEDFYTLYPENHDVVCHLFLDEIQHVEDWPTVIRRFFDTKKVEIYLSGSSSKLLSKEIASSLRGRSIATEIWPFDFNEFLLSHNIELEKTLFGRKSHDILYDSLKHYLVSGGFPETLSASVEDRRKILQEYVDVVVMRDIIDRYKITNLSLVKYLINTLLKNIGSGFSINKFANDVKSQGLSGAKNTIYDYLNYIEDAYLIFAVPLFSESLRKTHSNLKKIYAIDPGLVQAYSFSLNDNFGHLFENIVYLDLRRKGHKVHYYLTKERYEIDFLTEDPLGKIHLYQVVWDTSDEKTLAREMRALDAAKAELNVSGELITPESYIKQAWESLK